MSNTKAKAKTRVRRKRYMLVIMVLLLSLLFMTGCASLEDAAGNGDVVAGLLSNRSDSINLLLLFTVLSLLPSILIMLTCFTRIIIVLSLMRNGMGVQQMPPNQVLIGLALFLTLFVMSPVVDEIKVNAYEPYIAGTIDGEQAIEIGMEPIRGFMLRNTYKEDLAFFTNAATANTGEEFILDETLENPYASIPTRALIPAFITSEIKQGFKMGFYIYIPFIVIDMVVASVLMAMGMMMLPPVVISLPFKILLFVLVDGWTLTVKMLFSSFR